MGQSQSHVLYKQHFINNDMITRTNHYFGIGIDFFDFKTRHQNTSGRIAAFWFAYHLIGGHLISQLI